VAQAASGRVWMLVGRSAGPMNRCTRKTEQERKNRMGERRRGASRLKAKKGIQSGCFVRLSPCCRMNDSSFCC